jgi:hypothetical protein
MTKFYSALVHFNGNRAAQACSVNPSRESWPYDTTISAFEVGINERAVIGWHKSWTTIENNSEKRKCPLHDRICKFLSETGKAVGFWVRTRNWYWYRLSGRPASNFRLFSRRLLWTLLFAVLSYCMAVSLLGALNSWEMLCDYLKECFDTVTKD